MQEKGSFVYETEIKEMLIKRWIVKKGEFHSYSERDQTRNIGFILYILGQILE